jgi:sigma-B regulation protein RsbU (phosphoserine phosphatase)
MSPAETAPGLPRRVLAYALAGVYSLGLVVYCVAWMAAARLPPANTAPRVELGYDEEYRPTERAQLVLSTKRGSPAEAMGLAQGDRILLIDGLPFQSGDRENDNTQIREWRRLKAGDRVTLTVLPAGSRAPVVLTGVLRPLADSRRPVGWTELAASELRSSYPLPFVLVGVTVLLLRPRDRNAWLLALLFGSLVSAPDLFGRERVYAHLANFVYGCRAIFLSFMGPFFYLFFALFPERSPLERRAPWLKYALFAFASPFIVYGMATGNMALPPPIYQSLGKYIHDQICLWFETGTIVLAFASAAMSLFGAADAGTRRKLRLIFWGAAAAIFPSLVDLIVRNATGLASPTWVITVRVALAALFPLAFAYAVVKHRVLDIPVLLRRSARYLLVQRGFTLLCSLVSIGATLLFAIYVGGRLAPGSELSQPAGVALGAAFGTSVLWGGVQLHRRVGDHIDRSFFRGAYDARRILEDLAARTPFVTDRTELARLLEEQLRDALQPSALRVFFVESGADGAALRTATGDELSLPIDEPARAALRGHGRPWELTAEESSALPAAIAALRPECLAPLVARGGGWMGVIVLGIRRSEETYSNEDLRLLASVAAQAGATLDNLRLGEEAAARLERERRAEREMEIAQEVQRRLLPQAPPRLRTLDLAAHCLQARQVGGDSYDFLDLGGGRTGIVLADVSGKGVHAALLMANLQAHLRSQSTVRPFDAVKMLRQVNFALWRSTAPQHFATLFFGAYDDAERRLDYVNCGHNPPIVLRRDGRIERLSATASVIGIFERWNCTEAAVQLEAGDVLVVYSDGITEALREEEEFGEERFIEALREHAAAGARQLVEAVLERVQAFSAGNQSDDLTLIVARVVDAGGEEQPA